jgi:hypothetical protein
MSTSSRTVRRKAAAELHGKKNTSSAPCARPARGRA